MSLTLQHYQTGHPKIELCSRSTHVNLNLDFHSSCAEARHSRSVANSSGTKAHWPLTDFSVNFCVSESGCEGEVGGEEEGGEGDEGAGMDEAAGISDSEGALQQQQMLVRKRRQALEELVDDGVRRTRLLTWLVVVDG